MCLFPSVRSLLLCGCMAEACIERPEALLTLSSGLLHTNCVCICAGVSVAACRLLLLRGRLAQACIELPEGLFDPCQEGDEELMRFALCYNLLQVGVLASNCYIVWTIG
jgi:hypothetical protein